MPLTRGPGACDAFVGHADGRRGRSCLWGEAGVMRTPLGALPVPALTPDGDALARAYQEEGARIERTAPRLRWTLPRCTHLGREVGGR